MRRPKSNNDDGKRTVLVRDRMERLTEELRQPLSAASNYIGVVRLILEAADKRSVQTAVRNLELAELQILRASTIMQQISSLLQS